MDEEFNLVVGQHKRIYGAHVGDLNRSHVSVCVWQQLLRVFSLVQVVTLKGLSLLGEEIKSWVSGQHAETTNQLPDETDL